MSDDRERKRLCARVVELLKAERQKQNLSLNVLAAKSGLSRQMVSYVEQEKRHPTLDTLLRISSVLGIKLESVLAKARRLEQGEKGT